MNPNNPLPTHKRQLAVINFVQCCKSSVAIVAKNHVTGKKAEILSKVLMSTFVKPHSASMGSDNDPYEMSVGRIPCERKELPSGLAYFEFQSANASSLIV